MGSIPIRKHSQHALALPDPAKNFENSSSDQDNGEESGIFNRLDDDDRFWVDEKAADAAINSDAVKAYRYRFRILIEKYSVNVDVLGRWDNILHHERKDNHDNANLKYTVRMSVQTTFPGITPYSEPKTFCAPIHCSLYKTQCTRKTHCQAMWC
jgi:hypothetical protein